MTAKTTSVDRLQRTLNQSWFAVVAPAVIGLVLAVFSVRFLKNYGWSLFLGLPWLVSFLSAFCSSFRREIAFWIVYGKVVLSVLLLGAGIMIIALDGALCLLMALPLTLTIALVGAALGVAVGQISRRPRSTAVPMALIVTLPGMTVVEQAHRPPPELRSVTTRVEIAAPAKRVWPVVIAFPKIAEAPTGIFRGGIAYPTEAHIDGTGVGAVRYCVFSTGDFVEPITAWEEPMRLAFNVSSYPPPMKELSFYEHVDAPHLHGFMISERGQFRLIERDGKTILEGTTWYHHDLSPACYWVPMSDAIIHRIHQRVLDHIKRTVEAR
ncbi:MAG TPA: hypothetical protein VK961_23955 [Chthoniobacter sp.]|nr:hypothetical protein [Chthoniobacter sp.]